jgi:photosystem II stability/assembly factor-like uncharacterized protein
LGPISWIQVIQAKLEATVGGGIVMGKDFTICIGTLGQGIWRSTDGGDTWVRVRQGLYSESAVRALAVHPRDPSVIYAGADSGIYRSEDKGENWERLDSPMNQVPIWALAIDPVDPNIVFAGTRPSALFRSRDGGLKWEKLPVELAEECPNVVIPRVTALVVDPVDPNNIWAGIEVDGVRRSKDGGDTWEVVTGGITDPDIHNLAITLGPPKTLLTITPREVFSSTDDGVTWEPVQVGGQVSIPYCRGVAVKAGDPQVIYMGNGESAFGSLGALHRSRDRGRTWESLPLPVEPNGTIWNLAAHPADPDFLLASSVNGQVLFSADGGDSWVKFHREFGEVHALAWVPN